MTYTHHPLRAFDDPVLDRQRVFRHVLTALSEPGTIVSLPIHLTPPLPMAPATAAICLTLVDFETPVWLDAPFRASAAVLEYLAFHCGCPVVGAPSEALFALIGDSRSLPPLDTFDAGSADFPDRSATLICQVDDMDETGSLSLSGPGIKGICRLGLSGMCADFPGRMRANREQFPLGVDIFCVADTRVVGLPRSVSLES